MNFSGYWKINPWTSAMKYCFWLWRKLKKRKKKRFFFFFLITEVSFFCASILNGQLKKDQLNPLWNSITIWRWFFRVMFESRIWERRWSCFSDHNNNHILGNTDTTFLWNCYSKCCDEYPRCETNNWKKKLP